MTYNAYIYIYIIFVILVYSIDDQGPFFCGGGGVEGHRGKHYGGSEISSEPFRRLPHRELPRQNHPKTWLRNDPPKISILSIHLVQ